MGNNLAVVNGVLFAAAAKFCAAGRGKHSHDARLKSGPQGQLGC